MLLLILCTLKQCNDAVSTVFRRWLKSNGPLSFVSNPCLKSSYRPLAHTLEDQVIEKQYVSAALGDLTQLVGVVVSKPSILEIHIASIRFSHHPLFSPEHIFERKLISLYDEYRNNLTRNSLDDVKIKLNALRTVKHNLQNSQNIEPKLKKKLADTYVEVKDLRDKFFSMGQRRRLIVKTILQTWIALKAIRQNNSGSATSIKLCIRKEINDYEQESAQRTSDIEEVFAEVVDELNFDYERKLEKYKADLRYWKDQIHSKDTGEEHLPRKPKKPHSLVIDEDSIRREVSELLMNSSRPPGEPDVYFSISHEETKLNEELRTNDTQRENAVKSTKIYLKLFCNDVEVCKSKSYSLDNTFSCILNEHFSIQAKNIENITIEIHQQENTQVRRKIGAVVITLSDNSIPSLNNGRMAEALFQGEEIVHYRHEGIGSGVALHDILKSHNVDCYGTDEMLYTSGVLLYTCSWSYQADRIITYNGQTSTVGRNPSIAVANLAGKIEGDMFDSAGPRDPVLLRNVKNESLVKVEAEASHFRQVKEHVS